MTHEHGADAPHDDRVSSSLETAGAVAEMFGEDEPVQCSCHAAEKKSQNLSLAAAVFSLGALALSIVSIALPFLRKSDDVTFDAAAWAEFLRTIEERVDDDAPVAPAPTTYVPRPTPVRPTPVVTQTTPTPAPVETKPVESAPAETPTEPVEPSADGGAVAEEPVAADGSRQ